MYMLESWCVHFKKQGIQGNLNYQGEQKIL